MRRKREAWFSNVVVNRCFCWLVWCTVCTLSSAATPPRDTVPPTHCPHALAITHVPRPGPISCDDTPASFAIQVVRDLDLIQPCLGAIIRNVDITRNLFDPCPLLLHQISELVENVVYLPVGMLVGRLVLHIGYIGALRVYRGALGALGVCMVYNEVYTYV